MMCPTDEQERQESESHGASVLQEAPHLRQLLPTLDGARHDALRKCNRAHSKYQKSLLRRNYERDVKAGVCVRCHKLPATATNKRCQKCQDHHAKQKRLSK